MSTSKNALIGLNQVPGLAGGFDFGVIRVEDVI